MRGGGNCKSAHERACAVMATASVRAYVCGGGNCESVRERVCMVMVAACVAATVVIVLAKDGPRGLVRADKGLKLWSI